MAGQRGANIRPRRMYEAAEINGEVLYQRIAAAAEQQGIPIRHIITRIVPSGSSNWTKALRISKRPTPETIERVQAAIEDRPIPAPANRRKPVHPKVVDATPSAAAAAVSKPDEKPPVRVDRNPCPWCQVRMDIGCAHTRRLSQIADSLPMGVYVRF